MANLKHWLWLTTRKGLGPRGVRRLLDHFATPEQIYYADPEEYRLVAELTARGRAELADKSTRAADRILADCDRLGVRVMTLQDADYLDRLRQISDPPAVLYIRGKVFSFDDEVVIGIVGAREPTAYGRQMAVRLGLELARGGALVVSGIARGLDAAALQGAMKGGGTAVSVLGGGVDVYYPSENRCLYEDVAAVGALVSEYPPGTENKGEHFPVRNRIISGLSLGVVAVECEVRSGTMLTMDRALEQDRDLFAVPGPVDAPKSAGTNLLIQQGAKLVRSGNDILSEYRDRYPHRLTPWAALSPEEKRQRLDSVARDKGRREEKPPGAGRATNPEKPSAEGRELIPREKQKERFTDDELAVLSVLGAGTYSADQVVELTQIPVRRVTTALTMLQIQAAVMERPGRRFSALVELEEA